MRTVEASRHGQSTTRGTSRVVFAEKPFGWAERVRERLGVTRAGMAAYVGTPVRTYQRRARTGTLTGAASIKVEMLDALLGLGERVLGSEEEARMWLASPMLSFGGAAPVELLGSIRGYERLRSKLLQVETGTF